MHIYHLWVIYKIRVTSLIHIDLYWPFELPGKKNLEKTDSRKHFGLKTTKLESVITSVRYVFRYLSWKTTDMTTRIVQRETNATFIPRSQKGPKHRNRK